MKDLHLLPRVADSWTYLYLEHCRIDQHEKAIAFHDQRGMVPVPCASLMALMLGPGTSITQAAVRALADTGCLVIWTGEQGVRFYAQGLGETRSSARLQRQAALWADPAARMAVVRRMYEMRFPEKLPEDLTLQQIRGMEGVRVREAYAQASKANGVPWHGRSYKRERWSSTDPVNRALSAANSCLYGLCHAAILGSGYSPSLGFIHTGKMLSFVYDIADLYKTETTIPSAFAAVAHGVMDLESQVRRSLRDLFSATHFLPRVVDDLAALFGVEEEVQRFNTDPAAPGGLWSPDGEEQGGMNWANESESTDN